MKIAIVKGGFAGIQAQLQANKIAREVEDAERLLERRKAEIVALERRGINLKAQQREAESRARFYHVS